MIFSINRQIFDFMYLAFKFNWTIISKLAKYILKDILIFLDYDLDTPINHKPKQRKLITQSKFVLYAFMTHKHNFQNKTRKKEVMEGERIKTVIIIWIYAVNLITLFISLVVAW